jgi:hypothetical protein
MLVVPDIQDVYTPLQNNLIVPLSEVRIFYFLVCIREAANTVGNSAARSTYADVPQDNCLLILDWALLSSALNEDIYGSTDGFWKFCAVQGREHLEQLLETIPSMFQNNRIQESAFGAAVKVNHNQGHPSDRSIMQTYCEDCLSIAMILWVVTSWVSMCPSLQGAHLAMKSTGGKLLVFQTGSTISSYAFVTA